MRIRCHAQGKFYKIQCPEGTRVVRRSEDIPHDVLLVPFNGRELRIPTDPPELLPMLAEAGNFGVVLIGEPEPEERLAGVVCPGCGQDDVAWLQLRDDSETVRCDGCGTDFRLPVAVASRRSTLRRAGG
jgi:ribosomal protein S27E